MFRYAISPLLYFVVFSTGSAGLIYQVTWQKYLSRMLGSDCVATAIILATFLGGLSIGYYVCGKLTLLVKNHFKAYAYLEGIIGVWCLFFPSMFKLVDTSTETWSFAPPVLIIAQGIFCSSLLMLIPTICMGGTIPFLTRGLSKDISEATTVHAKVYSINTGGAFVGTLLAGFYLIPEFGLPLTIMGSAFLNIFAFAFFFILPETKERSKEPEIQKDSGQAQETTKFPPFILYGIAFLSGFYVMTMENVLIRITNLSIGSSSYTFSMIVSVFILSIAIGSYAVGRLKNIPRHLLFVNQAAIALLLMIVYTTLDTWPYFAHVVRIGVQSNTIGFWVFYFCVFLLLTGLLILPIGFMGATVPIAFHELKRDLKNVGKHSGLLFSWNTIGSLSGSLIGGIVFYYFMNNADAYLAAVMLAAISTCLAGWYTSRKLFGFGFGVLFLATALLLFNPSFNIENFKAGTFRFRSPQEYSLTGPRDFFEVFNNQAKQIFYKDGISASVSVLEYPKKHATDIPALSIVVNGKSDSSTRGDIATLKLIAHVPALLSEHLESALVIGLGTGVTAGELTLYPEFKEIEIAEISPTVIEALPLFGEATHNLHENPKAHFHIADAFRIMKRSEKKWDLILSEPSNPWVTGVDLLFTEEFYKLAKEHLSDNGILAQWFHVYAASPEMIGMVVNTIQMEFEQTRVLMTSPPDLLIIASNSPISEADLERAAKRLEDNKRVGDSLRGIGMESIESILIREIWSPSYLQDNFSEFGIQTMDNPRLHYLAGKSFFMGEQLPDHFLLHFSTAYCRDDFLMQKRKNGWPMALRSRETYESLLRSTIDTHIPVPLPVERALRLKAYLHNPDLFPLTDDERRAFRAELIPYITEDTGNQGDWGGTGLVDKSHRARTEALLNHVKRFRNWIAFYPLDGLKSVLKYGMENGKDDSEKNWYILHLANIYFLEDMNSSEARFLLGMVHKDDNNNIILDGADREILKVIQSNRSREGNSD